MSDRSGPESRSLIVSYIAPATAVIEMQAPEEVKACGEAPEVPAAEDVAGATAGFQLKGIDRVKAHIASLPHRDVLPVLYACSPQLQYRKDACDMNM